MSHSIANLGATTIDGYFYVDDATATSTTAVIDNTYALLPGFEDVRLWADGTWNVSDQATIADASRAVVFIDTGGTANFADLDIGVRSGSVADITLDVQLAMFARPTLTADDVRLAVESDDTQLNVLNGSLVQVDNLTAAEELSSEADIVVRGNSAGNILENGVLVTKNAEFIVNDTLIVGDEGTGTLTVDQGGQAFAGTLLAANQRGGGLSDPATGVVRVDGSGSLLHVDQEFDVGVKGNAELFVENGGALEAENLVITQSLGSQGEATVRGVGTWVDIDDHIKVGAASFGTMLIEQGAFVTTAKFRVANRNQNGDFSIVIGNGEATVQDFGTWLFATEEVSIAGNGRGVLNIRDQAGVTTPLVLIGIDNPEDPSQNGTLTLDRGTVETAGVTIFETGTLEGEGNIDNLGGPMAVTNDGLVKPGPIGAANTGRIDIDGDYLQESDGAIEFGIAGLTPGFDFGQLNATGSATLAGTLRILLLGGFAPVLGESFEMLTATGGLGGTEFDTTDLPVLAGDMGWNILYGTTTVTLQIANALDPGDFNGDGNVDGDDFLIWQASFGLDDGGDANGDGTTDGDDFLIWQSNFGSASGNAGQAAVPEPGTLALAALLAMAASVGISRSLLDRRSLPTTPNR